MLTILRRVTPAVWGTCSCEKCSDEPSGVPICPGGHAFGGRLLVIDGGPGNARSLAFRQKRRRRGAHGDQEHGARGETPHCRDAQKRAPDGDASVQKFVTNGDVCQGQQEQARKPQDETVVDRHDSGSSPLASVGRAPRDQVPGSRFQIPRCLESEIWNPDFERFPRASSARRPG